MALASITRSTWSANSSPLIATGQPSSNAHRDVLGGDLDVGSQWATPMIGSTISMPVASSSSDLASWVAPQMLASVEYAFSVGSRYGRPRGDEELAHLGAPAELVDELLVEPRLVDPQRSG